MKSEKSPEIQSLIDTAKEKAKALHNEEYQVIIKFPNDPNNLRLTYSHYTNGKIVLIEEIDAADSVICSCSFKGRSSNCDGGAEWIKDVKKAISTFKIKDWSTSGVWVDEYFKKH